MYVENGQCFHDIAIAFYAPQAARDSCVSLLSYLLSIHLFALHKDNPRQIEVRCRRIILFCIFCRIILFNLVIYLMNI